MNTINAEASTEFDSFTRFLKTMTLGFFGSGQHKITMNDLLLQDKAVLLDVRSKEEVQTASISFSHHLRLLHVPTNEIPDRLDEIPTDQPVAVFCSAGTRAAIVYAYLQIMGHSNVRVLAGGYSDLIEQALPGKLWKRLKAQGIHS